MIDRAQMLRPPQAIDAAICKLCGFDRVDWQERRDDGLIYVWAQVGRTVCHVVVSAGLMQIAAEPTTAFWNALSYAAYQHGIAQPDRAACRLLDHLVPPELGGPQPARPMPVTT